MLKIKLLKAWDHDGNTYRKGQTVLFEEEELANKLVAERIGEHVKEKKKEGEADDGDASKTLGDKGDDNATSYVGRDELKELLAEFTKNTQKALAEAVKQSAEFGHPDRKGVAIQVLDDELDKRYKDGKGGFMSFSSFAKSMYDWEVNDHRGMQPDLRKWTDACERYKDMIGSDDASGGFLVPSQFNASIMQTRLETSIARNGNATVIPMATNKLDWPAVSDTDHSGGVFFGGIQVYKPGEGSAITNKEPKFDMISLELKELKALAYVTNELMEDSPISMESLLNDLIGQAIAFTEDDEYINGVGGAQAQGIINSPCKIEVALNADRSVVISNMWSRLYPPSMSNAMWLIAHDEFPKIVQSVGATSLSRTILTAVDAGIADLPGVAGRIYGRPVVISEKVPKTTIAGAITLVDWSQYILAQKNNGNVVSASSMHFRFDRNEMAFRVVLRYDGKCWWKSSITPKNGGAKVSPIVTMGAP